MKNLLALAAVATFALTGCAPANTTPEAQPEVRTASYEKCGTGILCGTSAGITKSGITLYAYWNGLSDAQQKELSDKIAAHLNLADDEELKELADELQNSENRTYLKQQAASKAASDLTKRIKLLESKNPSRTEVGNFVRKTIDEKTADLETRLKALESKETIKPASVREPVVTPRGTLGKALSEPNPVPKVVADATRESGKTTPLSKADLLEPITVERETAVDPPMPDPRISKVIDGYGSLMWDGFPIAHASNKFVSFTGEKTDLPNGTLNCSYEIVSLPIAGCVLVDAGVWTFVDSAGVADWATKTLGKW